MQGSLTGGRGDDVFNYESLEDSTINATDVIEDFESGSDQIALSSDVLNIKMN